MQGEGKGGTAWIEKQCISLKSEGTNACISVTVTKTEDSQTIWRC